MPRKDLTTKSNQQTLGFNQVRHEVTSIDTQPTPAGGLIVTVIGGLIVREDEFLPVIFKMPLK